MKWYNKGFTREDVIEEKNNMDRLIIATNDDGYYSEGLQRMIAVAEKYGRVLVVAPDREVSGVGHSLTLRNIIRMRKVKAYHYIVEGNPCDCINMAIWYLVEQMKPALVLSGINNGWNVGEDALYSGTVAGAMEGALHYIPSVAISCKNNNKEMLDIASKVVDQIVSAVFRNGMPRRTFLNVNVPDASVKGYKITVLSAKKHKNIVIKRLDPRDEEYYWLARAEPDYHLNESSDISALKEGYISITPLKIDITDYDAITELSKWELDYFSK
jgi:5'-nucleotidase